MSMANGSFRTPRLSQARVGDAMHPGVLTCTSSTPVREAARTMVTHHVHCIVVGDPPAYGAVPTWRLLTDLDIVQASVDDAMEERTAGECTVTPAITIGDDEPLSRAARLMLQHGTTHVLVLASSSGRPAGVLSSLDIAGLAAWGEA